MTDVSVSMRVCVRVCVCVCTVGTCARYSAHCTLYMGSDTVRRHGGGLGEAHCGRRRARRCALCTVHALAYGGMPEVRRLRAGCEQRRAEQRDREERHEQAPAEVSAMDRRIHHTPMAMDTGHRGRGGRSARSIRRLRLRLRISVDHYEPRGTQHEARRTMDE